MDVLSDDVIARIVLAATQLVPMRQKYSAPLTIAQTSRRLFHVVTQRCPFLWEQLSSASSAEPTKHQIVPFVADHVPADTVRGVQALSLFLEHEWDDVGRLCCKNGGSIEHMTLGLHRLVWTQEEWNATFESMHRLSHLTLTFPCLDDIPHGTPPTLPVIPTLYSLDVHVRMGPAADILAAMLRTAQPRLAIVDLSAKDYLPLGTGRVAKPAQPMSNIMRYLAHHPLLTSVHLVLGDEGISLPDGDRDLLIESESVRYLDVTYGRLPPTSPEHFAFLGAFPNVCGLVLTHLKQNGTATTPVSHIPEGVTSLFLTNMSVGVDASSCRQCTQLRDLTLRHPVGMETLRGLGGLPQLRVLRVVGGTSLRSLEGVGSCSSLHTLVARARHLSDCGDICRLRTLKTMRISSEESLLRLPLHYSPFTDSLRNLEIDTWACANVENYERFGSFPRLKNLKLLGKGRSGAGWLLESVVESQSPLKTLYWSCDPGLRFAVTFPRATKLLIEFDQGHIV